MTINRASYVVEPRTINPSLHIKKFYNASMAMGMATTTLRISDCDLNKQFMKLGNKTHEFDNEEHYIRFLNEKMEYEKLTMDVLKKQGFVREPVD